MRCPSALFLRPHDVRWEQRRDSTGKAVRGVLDWRCLRCHRIVSTTTLTPSWALLSRMRRNAAANKAERRREA